MKPTHSARTRFAPRFLAAAACLTLGALGPGAHAQTQENEAAAEALFRQGVEKLNAGKPEEACPLLEASERRGPSVGTLLYLGECYARTARAASSWASFREAARMARQQKDEKREKMATTRASEVEKDVSYLSVTVVPAARIPGLQVRRDTTFVEDSLWGVALPVDPGDHVIEATAPGRTTSRKTVTIAAHGARAEVSIPPLDVAPVAKDAPPIASATVAPITSAAPSGSTSQPPPAPQDNAAPSRALPIGLLAGGGAGIVVGAVLLGVGVSKANSGISNLDKSTYDSAKGPYDAGWVLVGLGAVAAAVGGVLLATSSPSTDSPPSTGLSIHVEPVIGTRSSLMQLSGSF